MNPAPSVLSCAEAMLPTGGRTQQHSHPGCELIAISAGEAVVKTGRQRFVLIPGSVLIVPPGCVHDQYNRTPVRQCFAVLDRIGVVPPIAPEAHQCPPDEPLLRWISDLVRLHHDAGGTGCTESALITTILARLDLLAGRGKAPVRRLPPPLAALVRASEAAPADPLDHGAAQGISASHLRALSRQHLGMPLGEMHRLVRLRLAQKLLRTSFLPVAEVAVASGWSDANYFARFFRSRTGMSPRAFRQACRSG